MSEPTESVDEPVDVVEVEDTEFTFLGLTKEDVGTIVLRAVVSTVVMTGLQLLQKKANAAIDARSKANAEVIDTTATEA
jgi:hypothetical protein